MWRVGVTAAEVFLWYMKVYCKVNYKYNCTTFAILLSEGWGGLGGERGIPLSP